MWFVHKLWFDTHRSSQGGPQDLSTNPQDDPQIFPKLVQHRKESDNALPVLSQRRLQGA
jgi:hypothetical protein